MERRKSRVNEIHKGLNEKHKTIKFDFQISPRKIAFLDPKPHKGEDKKHLNNFILLTVR